MYKVPPTALWIIHSISAYWRFHLQMAPELWKTYFFLDYNADNQVINHYTHWLVLM